MANAIEMLRGDHEKVQKLFQQFEQSDENTKEQITKQTLHELEIHATLEEEIFYPAAREQVDEEAIDEALEEHHVAKLLLAELKKMRPGDDRFDAKYKVLAESVKHHIEEEERELFPSIQGSLDVNEIGQQMDARKQKLEQRLGLGNRRRKTRSRSKTSGTRGKARAKTAKRRSRASANRR
jgi:hemerythrin-like domain-containing protein